MQLYTKKEDTNTWSGQMDNPIVRKSFKIKKIESKTFNKISINLRKNEPEHNLVSETLKA
jgi:hypothetical protein